MDDHDDPDAGAAPTLTLRAGESDGGTDETLAPAEASLTTSAVIRAGGADDLRELVEVDPRHYAIGRELARGGMGRVLAARDRRLGRPVAIKELIASTPDARARFEREARITARLQHPAIVNVIEAGTWPGGEPFYAMRLVPGTSLDAALARRPTLVARLGLLPAVTAAVDALAYAHSRGVIHRDLKPSNVMVGEFGETVVIDWGLATEPGGDRGGGTAEPRPAPSAAGDTVAGAVLGTPAYMPVEQARGAPVDARADVYALGAVLYHVLAGAPPYAAPTADAVLAAVLAGPPAPLAVRAPGAPPDLVTIVDKAMAREAADRYPSAAELAADLASFQTGQLVAAHRYTAGQRLRRWVGRHRGAVAVAAIALVVLVAGAVVSVVHILREQARTERQRALATVSRSQAEDLLSFMLGDLRTKLEPLGRLDLLDDVARRAVAYYARSGEELSADERAGRAHARRDLGEVMLAQGHTDLALEQLRAALAVTRALAAEDPASAARQRDLAVSRDRVGDALLASGDTAGALAEYRASEAIAGALADAAPGDPERMRDVATAHDEIGAALRAQGDTAAALAEHRASLEILEALAARDPTDPRRRDVAAARSRVAGLLAAQGDTAGALAESQAARDVLQALADAAPGDADRRRELAVAHDKVGELLAARGDLAGARAAYEAALALRAPLAERDPTSADRQRELSISHLNLGQVRLAEGDAAGALAEYRACLAIDAALAARDPSSADRQRDLSITHGSIGDVLLELGDPSGALAEYRASLALDEAAAARDPTSADRQRDVAVSHAGIGHALLAQGDATAALAEYAQLLATVEALAARDPTSTDRQADLADARTYVGDARLAARDVAGAIDAYRAALAIRDTLASADPRNADWQDALLAGHEALGDALAAHAEPAAAAAQYDGALAVARRLADASPDDAAARARIEALTAKRRRASPPR